MNDSLCALLGALMLAAGGCKSSSAAALGGEQLINITSMGHAMDAATGIVGPLYAYGDSVGPAANPTGDDSVHSACVTAGFTLDQCSHIDSPTPGQPFAANANGAFCTKGTAALVLPGANGMLDFTDMWGAGMGLDLNNPGGDAGSKGEWDGSNYAGVAFDIAPGPGATAGVIPSNAIRVNFPFVGQQGTEPPYALGNERTNSNLPAKGGHVVIHWTDVGGPRPRTTDGGTAPKLDTTKLQSMQLQVFTNATTTTPYDFCISNLAVLTK